MAAMASVLPVGCKIMVRECAFFVVGKELEAVTGDAAAELAMLQKLMLR